MKLVRETSKKTKLCFSSIIKDRYQRTDIKDIDEKIKEVDSHFENYCKKQNLATSAKAISTNLTLLRKDCTLKIVGIGSWQKIFWNMFIEYLL